MKYLYLAIFIFLQFPGLFLLGQKSHTWYYNLSPKAAKQLYQGKALDTAMLGPALDAKAFESFPRYHLLSVQNKDEILKINLQPKLNCGVRAMMLGEDFAVQIYDAAGKEVTGAKVSLNGMPILFQSKQHLYLKKNFLPQEGKLEVEIQGRSFFYQLNSSIQKPPQADPELYPIQEPNAIRGYIAFNKPIFRHSDTLKAKIYAAQPDGRPYVGDLKLELKTDKLWWDTVVYVPRGSYALTLPLLDTLPLDLGYSLVASAISKNIQGQLNHTFQLEAYQLSDVQYNFYTEQTQYNAPSFIPLRLAARTTYNTPLADVDVEIKGFYHEFSFWKFSGKLDQDGTLLVQVPENLLPHRVLKLNFIATFTRPGAVMVQQEIWVGYDPVAIDLQVQAAQIHASAYGSDYHVWAEYPWGRELLYTGNEPYHAPFNPMVRAYSAGFNAPETILYLQSPEQKKLDEQIYWEVKNLREQQSLVLHNPLRVPIWYQVGTKDKVQSYQWTQDTVLAWQSTNSGSKNLYLHYAYWWGESWQVRQLLIPKRQQQLNIEWIAPERIYPGQSLDLRIKVQDEKGYPVAGVDLAAGAINSEFGERLPHSPLDIHAEQFFSETRINYTLSPLQVSWEKELDPAFYHKLKSLQQDSYYQYRFMEEPIVSQTQALPQEKDFYQQYAFVAPFVVHQHKMLTSMLVYLNDTLVYFGGNAESTPYSFRSRPGYQRISIRTPLGLYQMDSVYLKTGFQQNIIIDAERFHKAKTAYQVHFTPLPDTLTTAEKSMLTQQLLMLDTKQKQRQWYAWDDFGHSYTWVDRTEKTYSSGLLGPFVPGTRVHFIRPFERKQVFTFGKNPLILKEIKKPGLTDLKALNLWYRVPKTDDLYEIPLPHHAPKWVQELTGFTLDLAEIQVDTSYCFPVGPDLIARGKVVDLEDKTQYPMAGVNILLAQKREHTKYIDGAVTDEQSQFNLKLPAKAVYQLQFSFIGYITRDFKTCLVDSSITTTIPLWQDWRSLWENVMVTPIREQWQQEATKVITSIVYKQKKGGSSNPAIPTLPKFEVDALLHPITNHVRSRFSDYAFWQPSLLTDPDGEVAFSVKFPENITTWNAFAIGVDQVGEMGLGTRAIGAFKPLQAQLYTPHFLVSGDRVQIPAKVNNLISNPTLIHTYLKQNGQSLQDSNWVASTQHNIFQTIQAAAEEDSLKLEFGLQAGQYIDGEARNIPLIPSGRLRPHGQVIEITKDTLMAFPFTPDTKSAKLSLAPEGVLGLLMEDIIYLRDYSFGCNEQTSSKLTALLLEKSLRQLQGQAFTLEKEIPKGIAILEKRQQAGGAWGWWETDEPLHWITNYVLQTLLRAKEAGYAVKALDKGLQYLQTHLAQMNDEDYLTAVETLTKGGIKVDLTRLRSEPKPQSNEDVLYVKLLRQQLLQEHHLPYALDTLFKYRRIAPNGSTSWAGREVFGFNNYRITDCNIRNTLVAYNVLKKAGKTAELVKIRNYFLSNRGFHEGNYRYGGRWNNTLEVAKILEAILPDLMAESRQIQVKKTKQVKLSSAHPVLYTDTPFSLKLSQGDTFLVKKPQNDAVAYLTFLQFTDRIDSISEQQKKPLTVKSYFKGRSDSLKLNQPAQLTVEVKALEDMQYVMIEIPIPAGCTYASKDESNKSKHELRREYYPDRVLIFCNRLPGGWDQNFHISLMPQFSGEYTLNPVWVEDMYHPLSNGSNLLRKVVIEP